MRQFTLLSLFFSALHTLAAQINFTNHTHLLSPNKHYSGVAIAVLDMNGDGRDDIIRMNLGYLASVAYQQEPNMPFNTTPLQALGNESQWGMCAGDVDNNGFPDLLAGGFYDNIKILMADDNGANYNLIQLTQPTTFTQCVNFADINNDGHLDAFICHDDGEARIFGNDGTGNLVYQPGWINLATVPLSDNSGNFGSVWSDVDDDNDLDLYIATCRQGVNSPADGRRINQLFLNNGNGTYTQDTDNTSGLRIGAQSWTADFGDIDNDGDFDCFITNHDVKSQLLLNDGSGHYTDISAASGIEIIGGLPIQGVFRDFDNDGYVDILVAGSIHYLLRNNGNRTFTAVPSVFDSNQMESFAIGD
ncbi:MAG: FG-GAP repeat domain-containing protein, partial [Saprospiraceae bacterium]